MSQALPFVQTYLSAVEQLVDALETIQRAQGRVASDSTLVTNYFATPGVRTDITATDLTAANTAVSAILAAYNTGTNKAKLLFVL